MTIEDFSKYKSSDPTTKPNKLLIPVNNLGFDESGIHQFNDIYKYCLEKEADGTFNKFVITPSQGISCARENLRGCLWYITNKRTFIEILIRNVDARYYRFIIGYGKEEKTKDSLSGRQAFLIYKDELMRHGVNLEDLAIKNGKEVKSTIPAPRIDLEVAEDVTYYNAHHIDINSAYNAGMMEAFPILGPAIHTMYEKRTHIDKYKQVLNMTQGFMQSELVGYRFAHISKAGYVYTLRRLDELTEALLSQGFRILAYNTDGIWYQSIGECKRYHDDDEGPDIGQWKHDYVDCKVRFKSKGIYEFEGIKTKDGTRIYKPVFRGESSYEKIKPRSKWEWGDIYQGDLVKYRFVEGEGLERCC